MKRGVLIAAAVGAGLVAVLLFPDVAALGWVVACVALFTLSDKETQS